MARYTQQQLDSQYEKLPQVLREAIFSAEIAEKMYEIGRRNGLNIEKTGLLAEEAGYLVLGLTHPRVFVAQITQRLEITMDKAKEIAGQVNREIFFPLHEALKQTHGIDVKEETLTDTNRPMTRTDTDSAVKMNQGTPQIDLRPQYRPKMPEVTPPSKIPPIDLRNKQGVQQPGITHGGVIPKQGVSFPQKAPLKVPPQAPKPKEGSQQPVQTAAEPKPAFKEIPTGENIKTSPFGISSGKLVEELEKKMQPPSPSEELGARNLELREAPGEALHPPKSEAPSSSPPPNAPLKEEKIQTPSAPEPLARYGASMNRTEAGEQLNQAAPRTAKKPTEKPTEQEQTKQKYDPYRELVE